ncbi:alpha/beta hydrolase, partial [Pseudomonas aeruginosa]|nr:alpha/beta hydrolase [Pseudomonas aeruginosa]
YPALIQGVVHGVQPAVGAGTAYRRVRAGWEDFAGSIGLGGTGKKIMPVFANAAGPLELLPNHRYGAGWLRITCEGRVVAQLPEARVGQADPYMQIYMEPRAWWRLVDPLWIDPAVNKIKGPAALQALQKA